MTSTRPLIGALAIIGALSALPAHADGKEVEREQLKLILTQLTHIEMLAHQAAGHGIATPARYSFDYSRLLTDIEAIRDGVEFYLTPSRAQPREPVDFSSGYRLEHSGHE